MRRALTLSLALVACFVDEGPGEVETTTGWASSTGSTGDLTGGDDMCGDGQIVGAEQCDDGELNSAYGACTPACVPGVCGDGFPGPDEFCDDGNKIDDDACRNSCQRSVCGDGLVQVGESCDDGDLDQDDACTTLCAPPSCGDGVLSDPEECDLGERNAEGGHCSLDCEIAVCGDELVQPGEACEPPTPGCDATCRFTTCGNLMLDPGEPCDGVGEACTDFCSLPICGDGFRQDSEACDDGNARAGDDCTPDCQLSECGDGVIASDELCDDDTLIDGDGCDIDCQRDARYVFVTSRTYLGGEVGGLEGADKHCQLLADKAELPGIYRAWLSDGVSNPALRFARSDLRYVLPPSDIGVALPVAEDWSDLVDGELVRAIQVTEKGEPIVPAQTCDDDDRMAWTFTDASGGPLVGAPSCGDWTINNFGNSGSAGRVGGIDPGWTAGCPKISCGRALRLYCFEQPE